LNPKYDDDLDGAPTLSTFNVTLSCKDAGGKQKEPLGDVTTSLTW
jgi:hypothetical protein